MALFHFFVVRNGFDHVGNRTLGVLRGVFHHFLKAVGREFGIHAGKRELIAQDHGNNHTCDGHMRRKQQAESAEKYGYIDDAGIALADFDPAAI